MPSNVLTAQSVSVSDSNLYAIGRDQHNQFTSITNVNILNSGDNAGKLLLVPLIAMPSVREASSLWLLHNELIWHGCIATNLLC